jgi:hypothetical protein
MVEVEGGREAGEAGSVLEGEGRRRRDGEGRGLSVVWGSGKAGSFFLSHSAARMWNSFSKTNTYEAHFHLKKRKGLIAVYV